MLDLKCNPFRTVYYTTYEQVTVDEEKTVYECCHGWAHGNGPGCTEQVCGAGSCFHGGHCNANGMRSVLPAPKFSIENSLGRKIFSSKIKNNIVLVENFFRQKFTFAKSLSTKAAFDKIMRCRLTR